MVRPDGDRAELGDQAGKDEQPHALEDLLQKGIRADRQHRSQGFPLEGKCPLPAQINALLRVSEHCIEEDEEDHRFPDDGRDRRALDLHPREAERAEDQHIVQADVDEVPRNARLQDDLRLPDADLYGGEDRRHRLEKQRADQICEVDERIADIFVVRAHEPQNLFAVCIAKARQHGVDENGQRQRLLDAAVQREIVARALSACSDRRDPRAERLSEHLHEHLRLTDDPDRRRLRDAEAPDHDEIREQNEVEKDALERRRPCHTPVIAVQRLCRRHIALFFTCIQMGFECKEPCDRIHVPLLILPCGSLTRRAKEEPSPYALRQSGRIPRSSGTHRGTCAP